MSPTKKALVRAMSSILFNVNDTCNHFIMHMIIRIIMIIHIMFIINRINSRIRNRINVRVRAHSSSLFCLSRAIVRVRHAWAKRQTLSRLGRTFFRFQC